MASRHGPPSTPGSQQRQAADQREQRYPAGDRDPDAEQDPVDVRLAGVGSELAAAAGPGPRDREGGRPPQREHGDDPDRYVEDVTVGGVLPGGRRGEPRG